MYGKNLQGINLVLSCIILVQLTRSCKIIKVDFHKGIQMRDAYIVCILIYK